jgi:hypothetical protein
VTEENGDNDKQDNLPRQVWLSFAISDRIEQATTKVALGNLFLQNELENQIMLTREEHEKLVAKIRELQEGLESATEQVMPTPSNRSTPPAAAAFLLALIASKNSAQALLGDLEEVFQKNAERFGDSEARKMYWFEVARSVRPLVWQWIKRMGFITLVIDYVRSKFGL